MSDSEYNLEARIETEFGIPEPDDWSVLRMNDSEVVWEHADTLASLTLEQRKPEGTDLPFRIYLNAATSEEREQLYEDDWLAPALHVTDALLETYSAGHADGTRYE